MPMLTKKQKEKIRELKEKGFGPAAIAKEMKIHFDIVCYRYYPRIRERAIEYQRERKRERLKVKNPDRHEFFTFIEAYESGKDVVISYANYCAQILLYLSEFPKVGKRCKYIVKEIGRKLQSDVRWMLRHDLIKFDGKKHTLTYKGIDVCERIE